MKKLSIILPLMLAVICVSGCSKSEKAAETAATAGSETTVPEATVPETTVLETTEKSSEASKKPSDSGASGTLIVGFDQEFPPMGFIGEDGEYTGFDLELAKEVAKRLGLEYKAQPISWDAKDMELESGNIDCIWNGFTMTGREDAYTWSDPYMENSQVFVVNSDSGIKTIADLKDKVVEVQMDSSGLKALEENPDILNSFKQLITTPDYNTAFMDLQQGAVDAICMDVIVAGYQISERSADMIILDESLSKEEYGIGFKKGNTELRDKVNSCLKDMKEDGTLAEISTKWFSKDITTIK